MKSSCLIENILL